tara:strand:- start:332 stop:901 length:570 start_codon:yes stop_codon:yes gene_type:complete
MFFYKLLLKFSGWKVDKNIPENMNNCVMIAAPHTSNWDFYYCILSMKTLRIPMKFTIKKQWFRFPFNLIMKPLGGVPINTTQTKQNIKGGKVDLMSKLFTSYPNLVLMVTPEGTRSHNKKWKTGFYHIAKSANVPICLGYLDYKNKIAGIGKTIYPSGNIVEDMKEIMAFYLSKGAKFPEKFSLDTRFI